MNLTELLSNHREAFKQKFIEALAKKNSLTREETAVEFKDFIEQYVDEKYKHANRLVNRINEIEKPIFLNIRRDRMREDRCKICEANEPNVHAIEKKYGGRVEFFEVIEDRPEGALYQIIFHEEAEEKKMPLTAVINKRNILKFWAGKTVEAAVYEIYINKSLA
ncbi:MAG: hypothetical protein O8C64_08235 [Candidatus Methanoperedens sp.]|nr:hypothetical protein [Candidatus Methanoperedens sp.]MCZ7406308.1 hypothetical protein [Candidatus Methanoperedens sp.]